MARCRWSILSRRWIDGPLHPRPRKPHAQRSASRRAHAPAQPGRVRRPGRHPRPRQAAVKNSALRRAIKADRLFSKRCSLSSSSCVVPAGDGQHYGIKNRYLAMVIANNTKQLFFGCQPLRDSLGGVGRQGRTVRGYRENARAA